MRRLQSFKIVASLGVLVGNRSRQKSYSDDSSSFRADCDYVDLLLIGIKLGM